jgi:glutathione S-transferase
MRLMNVKQFLQLANYRRATQLEVDISGFPNVAAHFKRMQERPSVKKLLAYEKEVNEGFAKTA